MRCWGFTFYFVYHFYVYHLLLAILSDLVAASRFFFCNAYMAYMGVSKNRGKTPKMDGVQWNTLLKLMIWGETPLFLETPIYHISWESKVPPPKLPPQEIRP